MKIPVYYLGGFSKNIIGHLTELPDEQTSFQYEPDWIERGIELSPLHLPISTTKEVTTPTPSYSSLFGLFDDSLPDWWGAQMMQQFFEDKGIPWDKVSPLQKLTCTGLHAMGAIGYMPPPKAQGFRDELTIEVAELVTSAHTFTHGQTESLLPGLLRSGLAPGGAQPKVVLAFNKDFTRAVAGGGHMPMGFERWLLKFDLDPEYQNGIEEHAYSMMAKAAGIDTAETHILACSNGAHHFLSKRFDRPGDERRHIHTFSGITHTPIRKGLNYEDLINVTRKLTNRNDQTEEVFRRACFNVLSGNNDDHGKNHAFIMDTKGNWSLSPAYDLTHSSNPLADGVRAAGVCGKRIGITTADLLQLAKSEDITNGPDILDQVIQTIRTWPYWATQANLAPHRIDQVATEMIGLKV